MGNSTQKEKEEQSRSVYHSMDLNKSSKNMDDSKKNIIIPQTSTNNDDLVNKISDKITEQIN